MFVSEEQCDAYFRNPINEMIKEVKPSDQTSKTNSQLMPNHVLHNSLNDNPPAKLSVFAATIA